MCRIIPALLSLTNKTISLLKHGILDFISFRTMTVTIGGAERRIKAFVHGPFRFVALCYSKWLNSFDYIFV